MSKYGGFGTASASPSPSPPGSSGGGGGGGGGGGISGLTSLTPYMTQGGKFVEDVTAPSGDKKVALFIPKGTIARNRAGALLPNVIIQETKSKLNPPNDAKVIGLIYEILPDGATFDPPITLAFEYDAATITQGIAEKNLIINMWDKAAQTWVELASTADPQTNKVSTKISHLSIYAVMARTCPASFTATNLSITPGEVTLGESASISILITNTGDIADSYEVSLNIDNVVAQTKKVTLNGGGSEKISFSVTPNTAGEHTMRIGDLSGIFRVKAPQAPPAPPPVSVATPPARFVVSGLSVTPEEARPSDQVTISAVITNNGGTTGSYTVIFKVNEAEEDKRAVTIEAGKSETVTFTIARDTFGSYTVDINGNAGQFKVVMLPPPLPKPTGALPFQPSVQWWPLGAIIGGGVIIVGLLIFLILRRRNSD